MNSDKSSKKKKPSLMKGLNNLEQRIKKLQTSSCKRNLRMEEKLLYTSKGLSSRKRKLKIFKDSMMIYVQSMMREFSSKSKNTNKNYKKQS